MRRFLPRLGLSLLALAAVGCPGGLGGRALPPLLIAFPEAAGPAVELWLLAPGETREAGRPLAAGAQAFPAEFTLAGPDRERRPLGGELGGFVPGDGRLLIWYAAGEERLVRSCVAGGEPETVLSLRSGLEGVFFPERELLYLAETGEAQLRAYVASGDGPARRLVRAQVLRVSGDGSTVFAGEEKDGRLTLRALDSDGANERVLLDQAAGVESFQVADTGAALACLSRAADGSHLRLVDRQGVGRELGGGDREVTAYAFAPGRETLVWLERGPDGVVRLQSSAADGPLALGREISDFRLAPDGRRLACLVGYEDDSRELLVLPLNGDKGAVIDIAGQLLDFGYARLDESRLLIISSAGEDLYLVAAAADGRRPRFLLRAPGVGGRLQFVPGRPWLFFTAEDAAGRLTTRAVSAGGGTARVIAAAWAEFAPLDLAPDGRQLLFRGREEARDNPGLYRADLAGQEAPLLLDGGRKELPAAVFSPDGRQVIYAAGAGGRPPDLAVLQVPAAGAGSPTVLFAGARLLAVPWGRLCPFRSGLGPEQARVAAANRLRFGTVASGECAGEEGDEWTFIGQAGDVVTLEMESRAMDSFLELRGPDGAVLASDDNGGGGRDARIRFFSLPASGRYTVIARPRHGPAGEYTLSLGRVEGPANLLAYGDERDGNLVDPAGDQWLFRGRAGDRVTIAMNSSSFDCFLELQGPDGRAVASNDDGGPGNNSLIGNVALRQDGVYVIVARAYRRGQGGPYTLRLDGTQ